jgi:GNAT superfamily N-acetyltransferase
MNALDYHTETSLKDGRSARVYFASLQEQQELDRLCLYLAALPRVSGLPPGAIPAPQELAQGGPVEGAHYLVLQVEGAIAGAVILLDERQGYHREHVIRGQVDLLPDWRGHEAGRLLLQGLVQWAATQTGVKRLEFDTLACNEWLIELLGQVGFVVEGRARAGWYARTVEGEMYVDRVSLGLLLDEAISAGQESALAEPEPAIAPDDSVPDADCSAFFTDLIAQVRAFLPYELREFESRETANEAHMLVEGLPEGVSFAVAFRLASAEFGTPEMIELGVHWRRDPGFNQAQVERFQDKLEELGEAIGKKTLYADVWRGGWGRVARRLPYQSPDEAHAFMLAAQVAGFIQVLLPEAQIVTE